MIVRQATVADSELLAPLIETARALAYSFHVLRIG